VPGATANSSTQASPPSPGTNSAGTAQSSGRAPNARSGVTTGSADTGANNSGTDAAVAAENKLIDSKIKSICRGC